MGNLPSEVFNAQETYPPRPGRCSSSLPGFPHHRVPADGIVFKDGFVVRGKVKRENDTILLDPGTEAQIQVGVGSWAMGQQRTASSSV